jgi:hypothetical protein
VVAVYFIIFVFAFSQVFSILQSDIYLSVLIVAQLVRLSRKRFEKSLEISFSVTFLLLYAVFALNLHFFADINSTLAITFFIIFCDLIEFFDRPPNAPSYLGKKRRAYSYWGLFLSVMVIALGYYIFPVVIISLMLPIGTGLYFQETLLRSGQSPRAAWLTFLIFEAAIVAYMFLHWGGYGRLAIASYFLMPFALLSAYHHTFLKFWHLMLTAPILFVGAFIIRGGSQQSLTTEMAVGVTDHLIYTNQLYRGVLNPDPGIFQFLQQYLLFFLNWFPRDLWISKPMGSGYYSVDFFSERSAVGEEHNISLGFVGEQIFLLDNYYVFGLIFTLATIIMLRYFLLRRVRDNGMAAVIAVDVTLLTYFWGGMAAFGSRAWFVVIPILVLSYMRRVRVQKKYQAIPTSLAPHVQPHKLTR